MIPAVRLPTLHWGIGGQPRALLVHGLSASAQLWWRVGSELAELGWEAVAADLRGHGSAPRTRSYRLEEFAADLLELGGGWDAVVGHSLGGSVAALAALEPGFCRRLVLLDPVVSVPEDRFDQVRDAQRAELEVDTTDQLLRRYPGWSREDAFWKLQAVRVVSPRTVERVFDDNRPWDLTRRLGGLAVPGVLVTADPERDGLVAAETAQKLVGSNPSLESEPLPGVGHAIPRERPDLVVRLIVAPGG